MLRWCIIVRFAEFRPRTLLRINDSGPGRLYYLQRVQGGKLPGPNSLYESEVSPARCNVMDYDGWCMSEHRHCWIHGLLNFGVKLVEHSYVTFIVRD